MAFIPSKRFQNNELINSIADELYTKIEPLVKAKKNKELLKEFIVEVLGKRFGETQSKNPVVVMTESASRTKSPKSTPPAIR